MDLRISTHMTSRERFLRTMRFDKPDRAPYFEEGIRRNVIRAWRRQSLPKNADISEMFPSDRREEIEVDLEPRPKLGKWPAARQELDVLASRNWTCRASRSQYRTVKGSGWLDV